MTSEITKRLFTLREASVFLGRSPYSVRTLIWKGEMPVVTSGPATKRSKIWVDVEDLEKFIKANKKLVGEYF